MTDTSKTNRLINETSPYLLQHANNPVDWYPWGDEALTLAHREDKPILLSVGYSACHWCHVMEHESFEDDAVAALMNEHFVCIKVDREERPDIDRIYQLAHQMLTRRGGGWPLTVFLTPEGHAPIFAGTYFPKQARYGMPGFSDILTQIAEHFEKNRGNFADHDAAMRDTFERMNDAPGDPDEPDATLFSAASEELARNYDSANGGFGGAPKFPHPTNLEILLILAARGVSEVAPVMLTRTLDAMAEGGLNDQLRGGFCRYCVDADWTIPHFEKMLYDNGQLLSLYADASALSGGERYRAVVEETVSWIIGEMQDSAGGYYSTLDADSEGEEGKFYVWSTDELADIVPEKSWPTFEAHYGIARTPNFEGQWHLNISQRLDAVADAAQISLAEAQEHIADAKDALLDVRATRIRPGLDDKILTSWNALMIRGMARAARIFERNDWGDSAEKSLDFIRDTLWQNGRLMVTTRVGKTHLNAYLDDYVLLIDAVIELLRLRWRDGDLEFAIELAEVVLDHFEDVSGGGFFFTSDDHENLLARTKPTTDDAVPSGNGVAALAFGRLGHLVAEQRYLDAGARTLRMLTPHMQNYAAGHGSALMALDEYLDPPQNIILRYRDGVDISEWVNACTTPHNPGRSLICIPDTATALPGILAERTLRGDVTAYVCRGFSCDAPAESADELRRQLDA